jgi:hypothetical protein
MTDKADKVLNEIHRKRNGGFSTYKVRITVPFYIDVLVSAVSPERALKQIQWDLMPDDREHILNTAHWKHLYAKQFDDCSGPKILGRFDGDTPTLDDLLPDHPTEEEFKHVLEELDELSEDS